MTMNVAPRKADSLPPRPADDSKSSIMDGSGGSSKILKASSTSANAATVQWLRSKDPRIVRVSRAFGGKDRHSKVCTIKGLRDRRVRLSVPTAIQLYDLQDRLGLSQPSKVVDWLLDAAKHEIDELPPLPIQPGCEILGQINQHQSSALSTSSHHHKSLGDSSASKEGFLVKPSSPTSKLWIGNRHGDDLHHENENWTENNEEGTEEGNVNGGDDVASRSGNSSSSLYLEPTNYASLPNSALLHGLTSHMEHQDPHNFNLIPLSLHTSSSPSNHSQILLCPPLGVTAATTGTTPSYFPSLFMAASSASESTPRPSSSSGSHNLLLPTSLTTPPLFSHHMYMRSATRFISGNAANDGLDHSSQRSFASDGPSKNP